jgi:four helix bundle protein
MRRSAVSIPADIAEGHSREHTKEFRNFLSITQGSISELETELEIATRLGYVPPQKFNGLMTQIAVLAKQVRALREALAKRIAVQAKAPRN